MRLSSRFVTAEKAGRKFDYFSFFYSGSQFMSKISVFCNIMSVFIPKLIFYIYILLNLL